MAQYSNAVDISETNPYPLGQAQVLCHGVDITLHVPATGVHLNADMARDLATMLMQAAVSADANRAMVL